MNKDVLIDSCVVVDACLEFRINHKDARELLNRMAGAGIVCYISSHAHFKYAVAAITHFKREPEKLKRHPIDLTTMPNPKLQVVKLDNEYVNQLLRTLSGKPIPDLKSQDLIYFCIARDRRLTLITQDRKLRNTARKGGIESFDTSEALRILY
jgi:hypothetical protein